MGRQFGTSSASARIQRTLFSSPAIKPRIPEEENSRTEGNINIFGNETDIPLEWKSYSFSTHAGHKEIVDFAAACEAEEVIVYHTDPTNARPPLVAALEKNGHIVHNPVNGISEYLGEEYSRSN